MRNTIILILTTITLTAIISTSLSFYLFQKFAATELISTNQKYTAQTVSEKNINVKPISIPEDFVSTADKVTPAIVNVTSSKGDLRDSNGSGVIVSKDGYIITNNHVIEGGTTYEITLNDKRTFVAKLVGSDPTTDLALLKISANNLPVLKYGNSDNVNVGEWVLAVGNPFNLFSTVTAGIVSAKARNIDILQGEYSIESFIQTDAVVNPGNSGGALVNSAGQLVGINSAILTETGVFEGYSFAIPSNLVRKVIQDLKEFGEVKRAILGVRILSVDDDIAEKNGLASVKGVYIESVNPRSSADVAGLRSGDIILSVNGRNTNSIPELQEQVALFRPGDEISIDYVRNGQKIVNQNIRLKGLSQ